MGCAARWRKGATRMSRSDRDLKVAITVPRFVSALRADEDCLGEGESASALPVQRD
jgi:hypothetical protein